jgi:FeS assembly protein IscX
MNTWTWQDIDTIAHALLERHPERDPLGVSPEELRRLVTELPGFADTPQGGSEKTLEAILAAWYEEYES